MGLDSLIELYASDIIESDNMNLEKSFIQHGDTTVYEHSMNVCKMCLSIVYKFNINVDICSLIRGSLLHDYFLYDWHVSDKSHRLHGFTHGKCAMKNAIRDFHINDVEKNMISCHMFPLTLGLPRYKESIILCIADKICASKEFIYYNMFKLRKLCFLSNYVCILMLLIK